MTSMPLRHTALPFIVVLVAVIVVVIWSDRLAEQISNEPITVSLHGGNAASQQELLWQFEQALADAEELKQDSLYISAVQAYKSRAFTRAENYFVTLSHQYPGRPEILNYLGLVSMRRNELVAARSYFETSLQLDSSYAPSLINLGLYFTQLENFAAADSLYRRAMKVNPLQPRPHLNKGIMHCRVGEWSQAQDALQKAIDLSSGDQKAKALAYKGMAVFNQGDTTQAINDFNGSIELSPGYLLPRIYLALTSNDRAVCEGELRNVIALEPSYAPAHYYLGVVLQEQERIQEAELAFERALQLNPGDKDITELLGSFYIENDLISKAQSYFDQVYRQDTLSPKNFFFRAKLASRNGDQTTALALYDRAISESGGNFAEAFLNQGILLKNSGDVDGAIASYQKAIEMRDNYEAAYYNLALAHRAKGQNQEAVECYSKAIEINPLSSKAMYNLAFVLNEQGKETDAAGWWRKITESDPSYVKAWYNLGLYQYRRGEFDEAISTYTQLLNIAPSYAKGWYNLALSQKSKNLTREAIDSYERAIDLDPTYVAAWKNLGTINASLGNIDAAILQYQQAIDLDNQDSQLRFNLALQYEKKQQYSEAIIQLNKAVQLKPDYLKAIQKWKSLAEVSNNKIEMLRAEEFLIDLDDDPELTYELARSYHKANRYGDAIRVYDLAEERGKRDDWVAYWRGKAYEESGDESSALQEYELALRRDRYHKYSLYRASLIYNQQGDPRAAQYEQRILERYADFAQEKGIQ